MGAKLTTDEVKARVIKSNSELDLIHFLEEIPQFYKFKSSIFTNLDQRNAIKDDYISMKNHLQSIKHQFEINSPTYMNDFNKVSHTIEELEAFQILIQKGIQDKIKIMKDQGSHIEEIEMIGIEENSSPNSSARNLVLELGKQIIQRVWNGQDDKMSGILHGIQSLRDNLYKFIILIQKGIQERIHIKKYKGSNIKEVEITGIGENISVSKNANISPPSSEMSYPRNLILELGEQIIQRVWDGQLDKLSGILHGIQLIRDNLHKLIYTREDRISLELQNQLFQQVGYMYRQNLISREAFKKFCQSKITLNIAAFNMSHTSFYEVIKSVSHINVLNNWIFENYRNIYEVLDENNKRYFSYISLKASHHRYGKIGSFDLKDLFQEDKLFHTLEYLVSSPSGNSDSRIKLQELNNQDQNNYVKIEEFVQELISMFQNDGVNTVRNAERENSFSFLAFIKNNYGLEMFEIEKGEKFGEKMSLMSSSLQFLRELNNIHWYLISGKLLGRNIQETKIPIGEEVLMIHKLSNYLISKNQNLFMESEMSKYCRTCELKLVKKMIDISIDEIMDEHEYYFMVNPPS